MKNTKKIKVQEAEYIIALCWLFDRKIITKEEILSEIKK